VFKRSKGFSCAAKLVKRLPYRRTIHYRCGCCYRLALLSPSIPHAALHPPATHSSTWFSSYILFKYIQSTDDGTYIIIKDTQYSSLYIIYLLIDYTIIKNYNLQRNKNKNEKNYVNVTSYIVYSELLMQHLIYLNKNVNFFERRQLRIYILL